MQVSFQYKKSKEEKLINGVKAVSVSGNTLMVDWDIHFNLNEIEKLLVIEEWDRGEKEF